MNRWIASIRASGTTFTDPPVPVGTFIAETSLEVPPTDTAAVQAANHFGLPQTPPLVFRPFSPYDGDRPDGDGFTSEECTFWLTERFDNPMTDHVANAAVVQAVEEFTQTEEGTGENPRRG
jgi:hypothetical protein